MRCLTEALRAHYRLMESGLTITTHYREKSKTAEPYRRYIPRRSHKHVRKIAK